MSQKPNQQLLTYYQRAVSNVQTNPDSAVNDARKAAELVCKSIIAEAGKRLNSKATLYNLLKQISDDNIPINSKLILAIRTIQVYANYGAHDQGFQTQVTSSRSISNNPEGSEAGKCFGHTVNHRAELSPEDIIPCMDAFTQMLNTFVGDHMKQELSFPKQEPLKIGGLQDYTIKIGTSNLTVTDAIIQGWKYEEFFQKLDIHTRLIPRKWNNQILSDLEDDTLDMAIYNKESTLAHLRDNPNSGIHLIRDVCSSMGGRNFYVLASNAGKWEPMTFQQFKTALQPGDMIAVRRNSDLEESLLFILDSSMEELESRGIKFIDYHSDQGLMIFDINPDVLLISGQDLRFLAEREGGYTEVVNYGSLPADKKSFFDKNSINSFVVGPKVYNAFGKSFLETVATQLMINFYSSNISQTNRNHIREELRPQVRQICHDDETADYIISRILFETYRIL